jgi:carboxyl-terminal processing protease
MAARTLCWLVLFTMLGAAALRLQNVLSPGSTDALYHEQAVYQQLRGLIHERYVTEVKEPEERKLFYGAMDGMANSLDAHSRFFPPDDYSSFKTDTTGELEGVGIEIDYSEARGLYVVTPIQDTPAWRSGILPGDQILKIDGRSTKDLKHDEAMRLVRGKPGTSVTLTVLHEGEKEPVDIALTRAVIEIKSVQVAELLGTEWVPEGGPRIGYVEVIKFQQRTAQDLDAALKRLEADGMEALILDLRQNRGGLLKSAEEVADLFLKDGPVVSVVTREKKEQVRTASGEGTHPDYPLAVLIDAQSASASEIVAGALKDRKRAVLVGDKTYGKFSVQEVIPVQLGKWGEAALKLTIAKYKTPCGACIDGQGIEPDHLVPSSVEQQRALNMDRRRRHLRDNNPRGGTPIKLPQDDKQEPFVDAQLKKAVEVLLDQLKKN